MKYLKSIAEKVRSNPRVLGYSLEDIRIVEINMGKQFPLAYIEFLQIMGKRVDFFAGIDYSMYELDSYQSGAECMFFQNFGDRGLKYAKDYLFFVSSQACNYFYFSLSQGDNPPVHFIHEGHRALNPIRSYPSFTSFVEEMLGRRMISKTKD